MGVGKTGRLKKLSRGRRFYRIFKGGSTSVTGCGCSNGFKVTIESGSVNCKQAGISGGFGGGISREHGTPEAVILPESFLIMMSDQMQAQRFERKYFISPEQALQVRSFASAYLEPDEHSATRPDYAYPVHSLYLDSDALATYWAFVQCEKRRFKLRVRYYDDDPESPLFFELKRREGECILKQRAVVRRSAGVALLEGQWPGPEHLVVDQPRHLVALERFCRLMHRLDARPVAHVAYLREAWTRPDTNSVRLTVDHLVRAELQSEPVFSTQMSSPVYPFGEQQILELKFTDRFPHWFNEIVQHFNLVSTGVPKYCGSVALMEERGEVQPQRGGSERLAELLRFC